MSRFKRATKSQAKARIAVFGPSGAGKTFSTLRVARGLAGEGGRIAVIDTERGSASKYSDRFVFDALELDDRTIDGYCQAINDAAEDGYDVLIIDSLSHAWQTLLEEVEKLAKGKYRGNTWSAWSEGTPLQRRLVQAILRFPGHVLATMRSKTEWTTVDDGKGRKSPQRVGLAPEQGKGVEYEFDILVEISTEHIGHVIKDRSGRFQDKLVEKPDEKFGRELAAWLADGEPAKAVATEVRVATADVPALMTKASQAIAKASSTQQIASCRRQLDKYLSDGTFTTDQWSALTDQLDARSDSLEGIVDGVA